GFAADRPASCPPQRRPESGPPLNDGRPQPPHRVSLLTSRSLPTRVQTTGRPSTTADRSQHIAHRFQSTSQLLDPRHSGTSDKGSPFGDRATTSRPTARRPADCSPAAPRQWAPLNDRVHHRQLTAALPTNQPTAHPSNAPTTGHRSATGSTTASTSHPTTRKPARCSAPAAPRQWAPLNDRVHHRQL